MNRSVRLLSLMMLSAAITGCGGGGGGGATAAPPAGGPAPAPAPGPAPAAGPAPAPAPGEPSAPTEATTGLTAPTLSLSTSISQQALVSSFIVLAQEMADAQKVADEAAAAQKIAQFAPGLGGNAAGAFACPGGGQIAYTPAGAGLTYLYLDCATSGAIFNGSATIAATPTGYTLQYSNLTATGTDAPNGTLNGSTTCTPKTGGGADCVTTLASFVWGYDATYAGGLADGAHQCSCNGTWNVVFENFGPTSGTAYVFATNGKAVVTRTSASTVDVTQTLTGGQPQSIPNVPIANP
jgi:hypothetical protein